MANRIIFTTPFRVSFPHLATPHAQKPGDTPKFQLSMMFPKNQVCHLNNQPSNYDNIWFALDEVCQEEFGCDFQTATAPGMGINYPPKFKDGDTVFEKDKQGNPIPGKIAPQSANMWILSAKNEEPVGTVGPDGKTDIAPGAIYAGSWARAQLEVSAYTGSHGRVVVAKVLNVQMCYDDERFGGRAPTQAASTAFADKAVADTNVQAGYGQQGAMPAVNPAAGAPTPPGAAPTPPAAAAAPKLVMIATDFTYEQYIAAGHTDETLIAQGLAKMETPAAPTPAAPSPAAPASPSAPSPAATGAPTPGAPSPAPATPAAAAPTPAAPSAPAAPTPPPANTPKVIMNEGEASYESYIEMGWTDELIIQHGKGTPAPNYLNPTA